MRKSFLFILILNVFMSAMLWGGSNGTRDGLPLSAAKLNLSVHLMALLFMFPLVVVVVQISRMGLKFQETSVMRSKK
ncbi:MAG: hypothetical protein WAV76_16665 [Bacteroidota bacterium]